MYVIPAVDLQHGRCVRLIQGDFARETVYDTDPVAPARRWQELGARWLHVVDLDGAREGRPAQLDLVAAIAGALSIPVELGGGLRSEEAVAAALEAGVARAIVGTAVALDRELAARLVARFGEQLVMGIDAREGWVAIKGWQEILDLRAVELARDLERLGARRLIYTDIGRDGMLAGANLPAMKQMIEAVSLPVVASGGVTTPADLEALGRLGAEAAIVGKALYDGKLDPGLIAQDFPRGNADAG